MLRIPAVLVPIGRKRSPYERHRSRTRPAPFLFIFPFFYTHSFFVPHPHNPPYAAAGRRPPETTSALPSPPRPSLDKRAAMADTMSATPRELGCRMHAPRQVQGRHIPDDQAAKQTVAPAITPWHLHHDLSIEVDETSRLRMGLDLLPADKHRRSTTINHDRTRVEVWTMEDKPRRMRMEEW